MTYEKFTTEFGNIVARHNMTDVCSESVLNLILEFLPSLKVFSTFDKFKRESKVETLYSQTDHKNVTYYLCI